MRPVRIHFERNAVFVAFCRIAFHIEVNLPNRIEVFLLRPIDEAEKGISRSLT